MLKFPGHRRYAVSLTLEGLAGSTVIDVATDMLEVANRLNIPVSLQMNGAHLFAVPGMDLSALEQSYKAQIERASC